MSTKPNRGRILMLDEADAAEVLGVWLLGQLKLRGVTQVDVHEERPSVFEMKAGAQEITWRRVRLALPDRNRTLEVEDLSYRIEHDHKAAEHLDAFAAPPVYGPPMTIDPENTATWPGVTTTPVRVRLSESVAIPDWAREVDAYVSPMDGGKSWVFRTYEAPHSIIPMGDVATWRRIW